MAFVTSEVDSAVWFKHFSELYTMPPAIIAGGVESACRAHAVVAF